MLPDAYDAGLASEIETATVLRAYRPGVEPRSSSQAHATAGIFHKPCRGVLLLPLTRVDGEGLGKRVLYVLLCLVL